MPNHKKAFLECEVENGIFNNERSIKIIGLNGEKYQAIVDKRDVITNKDPIDEQNLKGFVRVDVAVRYKNKKEYLVDLPQETFTSGPRIAVGAESIKYKL